VIQPEDENENEEMVVVTYEEGLAKLGLNRPVHPLYPESPIEEMSASPSPRAQLGRGAYGYGVERGSEEGSNWLPSYYRTASRRREEGNESVNESDLGYRWDRV